MGVICPNCRRDLKGKAKFCGYCGWSIGQEKSKGERKDRLTTSSKHEPLFDPYLCAHCNQPKKYVKQYKQWFCSRCNNYNTKTIKFPYQATFYCTICDKALAYVSKYDKWYCNTCRNYTLDIEQFYLDANEQIQKCFTNCHYNTSGYSKKFVKLSSWQDLGNLTVTNKSIIFSGNRYWLKTGVIRNISSEYLDISQEISGYISQGEKQKYCIRIDYQEPSSGLDNVAYLIGRKGANEWEGRNKTDKIYNYIYNWWYDTQKPQEEHKPPKVVKEVKPTSPIATEVKPTKAEVEIQWIEDEKAEEVKAEEIDVKEVEAEVVKTVETKAVEPKAEEPKAEEPEAEEPKAEEPDEKVECDELAGIKVLSAVNYEHAKIIYKVKVENNSITSISDVNITPYIPRDIFSLEDEEKNIPLIKKGEAKTSTFKIRPKGECGNVEISGDVKYYDTKEDVYNTIKIKARQTQIVCPMLKAIHIKDEEWREIVSPLISVKETTNDVPIGAEELFDIVSDVIKDMNMHMLKPKIGKTRYVGRFYSEGIKGFKYAVQVEILGGMENSKLILNAYAENQECLIGCYHKVLDEIEDRTDIKQYIKDSIIVKGDYIVGGGKIEVKDSVVQRSKLGSSDDEKKDSKVDWD